jgi:hypothetical protein
MSLRAIRRRCEAILRDIYVPEPFDVATFAQAVGERRGRRLVLLPKNDRCGPYGVCLARPDADYVFYDAETSALHREHIILHELAHLLCGHEKVGLFNETVRSELIPDLEDGVEGRYMCRTVCRGVEEQEAEMLASLLRERVERTRRAGSAPTTREDEVVLRRF